MNVVEVARFIGGSVPTFLLLVLIKKICFVLYFKKAPDLKKHLGASVLTTFLVCALISYFGMGEDLEKWVGALGIYGVWSLIWGAWFYWRGRKPVSRP